MKKKLVALTLVVFLSVMIPVPALAIDLKLEGNVGYFHDFDGETLRGIAIKFAEKQMFGMPFTFALGMIEQSTEIGDLESSLVVSTDIKNLFKLAGFKYVFPEEVELGLYHTSLHGNSSIGAFFAIGWNF